MKMDNVLPTLYKQQISYWWNFISSKEIHKAVWKSPDKKNCYQIDHMCINTKFRRSLLDVRVKPGADAASNHYLVMGKLQLKLRKHENIRVRLKYNVELLQDNTTQFTELSAETHDNHR